MTQVALDELRRLQGITGEPSMAGGGCALCYGGRGHKMTNGENRKMEKHTVSLTVVVAAYVRPPKARLMAAAIWRETEGTGEVESEQTVTKTEIRRYLRARRNTAEITDASATVFALGRGGFTGGGELERGRTEEGQREGCGSAL